MYLVPPIRIRLFVDKYLIDIGRILDSPVAFRIPFVVPRVFANRCCIRRRIGKRTREIKHTRTLTISVCNGTCVEGKISEIVAFVPIIKSASGHLHHSCWHIRTRDLNCVSPRDRHCPLTSLIIAYRLLDKTR